MYNGSRQLKDKELEKKKKRGLVKNPLGLVGHAQNKSKTHLTQHRYYIGNRTRI